MVRFRTDWTLIAVILALTGLSLTLIWSTNADYLLPQFLYFIVGFICFFIFSQLDQRIIYNLAKLFYVFSLIILVISLLNNEIRGASRWIDVFGIRMQPAEITKPFIIVGYSYYLTRKKTASLIFYIKTAVIYLSPIIIIFLQPDLGNALIYTIFLIGMVFVNKIDLRIIGAGFVTVFLSSPLFWLILKPYQKERILSFIKPENDPQGASYNAIQAMIAVGSGRIFGQGIGRGSQSHLRFLPENHTDFIFASLTEELGLFGSLMLLVLYGLIFQKILKIAFAVSDKFSYLVLMGFFTQLLAQVFINISMNIGLIPITGVTLPLISSGGSSVIATLVTLGLTVALRSTKKQTELVIR